MRIQARLFLGTAVLVLALMGIQWWLHIHQLSAIQQNLGEVASEVGAQVLARSPAMFVNMIPAKRVEGLDLKDLAGVKDQVVNRLEA